MLCLFNRQHPHTHTHMCLWPCMQKADTARVAVASARVLLGPVAFELVAANQIAKGDVLTVSKLAGIMAAKQTAYLIPLCHPLMLSKVRQQTNWLSHYAGKHVVYRR